MLNIKNLSISIGNKSFFENINLEIAQGEILHLVGPNGCGKSTLIESLLDLRQEYHGSIERNFAISEYGYLPQVAHQFPKIHLLLKDICKQEFSFYPKELFDKHWHHASGGERKKALIAKAMHEAKKLLVLDEPFNHLDQASIKNVSSEIEALADTGVTVIFTGHNDIISKSKVCEVILWRS